MQGLVGDYGDSDSEGDDKLAGSAKVPAAETPAQALSGASAQPVASPSTRAPPLPNAADLLEGKFPSSLHAGRGRQAAGKRDQPSTAPGRQAFQPKAARTGAQRTPAASRQSAAAGGFLPPQLKGRPNVVTEDLDKIGMKSKSRPPPGPIKS